MPFEREPIFHDRQSLIVDTDPALTTTSNVFVDVPGAILTTKDLGVTGNYLAWVSMEITATNNNSEVTFRGEINGVATGLERPVHFGPGAGGDFASVELLGFGVNILKGVEIKLQWKVSNGTASLLNCTMTIDGIPDNRVIE